MDKINIGIVGYGNLGKGVEQALSYNSDMCLKAVFTRRDVNALDTNSLVVHISEIEEYKGIIDVMILCGGSAKDLDVQGPMIAAHFNTIDSFDTHSRIPEYYEKMNQVAKNSGTCSLISTGWDPGLFSLQRLLGLSILPVGKEYTFWGIGVSQGHSEAIRQVTGVKLAKQYTIPKEEALAKVRSGENPNLTIMERHARICYVVPEDGANTEQIKDNIINMPNYFADYDTSVHFITEAEYNKEHLGTPHGGIVIRTGQTSPTAKQKVEFGIELASNPEFTASVVVAYTRAVSKMAALGHKGAYTVFDIPFAFLSPYSPEQLRKELL
ncbi:MAG: diaminopimelate dehydrogenase [Syntrophomonadaceae bacterium]|nr:diaminopimelate dehydrogenase [Syntrophomonadaceae bacterium]